VSPILIDSDVLVWLTRGYAAAARRLHVIDTWHISVVTYIELAQGCRDKAELARLKKGLAARNTEIMPVTPSISRRASLLIDELALSHGLRLADALIGATAVEHQFTLLIGNAAHFGPISGLNIEAFVP
jgi:predicted nucleic acid-binding protein